MPTRLYHITHVNNLASVIEQGGLWCDNRRAALDLDPIGIAHAHIKARRARREVPLAPRGTLADYVPAYFGPRSPMLYAIHCGQVDGYAGGQGQVVHLVTTAEAVAESGLPFVFTDGHADMSITEFFDDLANLFKIDWAVIGATYWNDTQQDGDRKRRRQAEFLIHHQLAWGLIQEIGVISNAMAAHVRAILANAPYKPDVAVRKTWYY
jgi:hypothetical protein